MDTIAARVRQAHPKYNEGAGVALVPLLEQVVGDARRALLVMLGAVGCVLLIACANVANLLLARAAGRRREIALRVALGASRWRVIRCLLTESVLLGVAGGALGLAAAALGVRAFVAVDPLKLPRIQEIAVDGGVLLFTFVVAVATGVVFGIAPALGLSRPDLNQALKDGAPGHAAGGLRRNRGRNALGVAQVALAIVLLVGSGLLLRSFVQRVTVPLGFRPDGVLAVELPWFAHRRIDEVLERLRALPGVETAGAGTAFPHEQAGTTGSFEAEGRPAMPGEDLVAGKMVVTPDYFRAAGMTLRQGRFLTDADGAGAPAAAVINEALARRCFPGQDPIGRGIRSGGPEAWGPIVGIVGNVKGFSVDGDPMPMIYWSHRQAQWGNGVQVLVQTGVPPASLAGAVRKEIRSLNPRWEIQRLGAIEDLLSASVAVPRFYTLLVGVFAALAVALAAVGVYGILSYSVAQRRHEIGVRMALGAERGDVLHLVVTQGLVLILAGVALGLAAAWSSTRVIENLLFQVRPDDLGTFIAVPLALIAVGLAACYIPARRAARIDPMEALRHE
jgi:putative ABC transport system permease protein